MATKNYWSMSASSSRINQEEIILLKNVIESVEKISTTDMNIINFKQYITQREKNKTRDRIWQVVRNFVIFKILQV